MMVGEQKTQNSEQSRAAKPDKAIGVAVGAGLAGLAVGLLANLGRKLAAGSVARAKGDWDDILIAEHRAVSAIFDELENSRHDQVAKRKALVGKLKAALTRHAVQEEMVIYPALILSEAAGEHSDPYADHAQMKRWLNNLEHSIIATPGFMSQVAALRKLIDEHVAAEEQDLFPALKAAKSVAENERLTRELCEERQKFA